MTGCAELEKSLRECMDVPVCLPAFFVCEALEIGGVFFKKEWG